MPAAHAPRQPRLSGPEERGAQTPPRRAIRGGALMAAASGGRQLLRLAVTITLARLLSPQEFGLVAMLTALFAIVSVFQDLGLSAATVQRSRIEPRTVSTLFWLSAAIGALLTLGFELLAPWLADFLEQPELEPLCRVTALTFLLNAAGVQHRALLQRRMEFAAQARIDLLSALLGGAAALAMAAAGWGYWALVGQILVTDAAALLLLVSALRFPLMAPRYTAEVRDMLRFGGSLLGFNLLHGFSQNLYIALLGKVAGAAASGVYTRALALASIPQGFLYTAAAHVALPHLATVKDADAEFCRFYYHGVQLLALVTVPAAAMFAVFGDQISYCVYGERWSEVPALLRIFALGMSVAPLLHSTGQVFLARGDSRRLLRWGVFSASLTCLATLAGLPWGARGVAWGWSASMLAALLPCLAYAFRRTGLSLRGLAGAVGGVYAATACLLPIGGLLRWLLQDLSVWLQLPLSLTLCMLAYLALCYQVFGQRVLIDSVLGSVLARPRRS